MTDALPTPCVWPSSQLVHLCKSRKCRARSVLARAAVVCEKVRVLALTATVVGVRAGALRHGVGCPLVGLAAGRAHAKG